MVERSESKERVGASKAKPAAARKSKAADPAKQFAFAAARLMADLHCEEVVVLDTRGLSPVTDYLVIATGTSDRQMRSVAENVEDLGREHDFERYGHESDERALWVVVDFVEVVVHLFEPATRGHYDLEMLWGDAPRLRWRR